MSDSLQISSYLPSLTTTFIPTLSGETPYIPVLDRFTCVRNPELFRCIRYPKYTEVRYIEGLLYMQWRVMGVGSVSTWVNKSIRDSIILKNLSKHQSGIQQSRVASVEMSCRRGACVVREWDGESIESIRERFGVGVTGWQRIMWTLKWLNGWSVVLWHGLGTWWEWMRMTLWREYEGSIEGVSGGNHQWNRSIEWMSSCWRESWQARD